MTILDELHRSRRGGRGVRLAAVYRDLAAGLEPCRQESHSWRRRALDLEPGPPALPRRRRDCRSLPRPAAPLGTVGETIPERRATAETLGRALVAPARSRQDRGVDESPARVLHAAPEDAARLLAHEADYCERNRERMRYPEFRRKGLFVVRGWSRPAARTVIGARLKRWGTFWTVRGANAVIALGCRLSGKFEDYWEARARAA